ncbi:hypothetical protein BBJ28_00025442, partial [Nothophytophthora sp. Chile5]
QEKDEEGPKAAKKPSVATQKRGKAKGSLAKAAKATISSAKVVTAKASAAQPSAKSLARQRPVLWDKAKEKDLQEANMSKKGQKKPTEKQGKQEDGGDAEEKEVQKKKAGVQKKKAVETPMVLDVETSTDSGVEKRSRSGVVKASGDGSGKRGGAKKGKRKSASAAESSSGGESRFSPHEIMPANESAVVSERAAPVVAGVGDDEDLPTQLKFLAVKKPRQQHSATSDDRAKMEKAHAAAPHDAPPIPRKPYKTMADATSAVEQYGKAEGHFFRIRSTKSVAMFSGKHVPGYD